MDFSKNIINKPPQIKPAQLKAKPLSKMPLTKGKRVGGSMDRTSGNNKVCVKQHLYLSFRY